MSVALRYSKHRDEAKLILNDSFLKVFSKINQFDTKQSFKLWFRTIIIHTAIDYYRKDKWFDRLVGLDDKNLIASNSFNEGWNNLLYEELIEQIQQLSPGYRIVFNLYAIEGYKHHEIAEKLNISIGSSKSNYAKARRKLQQALKKNRPDKFLKHGK